MSAPAKLNHYPVPYHWYLPPFWEARYFRALELARPWSPEGGPARDSTWAWGSGCPTPDRSFDLVVSFAVLEHVQDQACVAREVFRVLRPGGQMHFEMPNYLYPREVSTPTST